MTSVATNDEAINKLCMTYSREKRNWLQEMYRPLFFLLEYPVCLALGHTLDRTPVCQLQFATVIDTPGEMVVLLPMS